MAVAATDLRWLNGFLVADHEGRVVGRVECPMYGTAPDVPDALAVRSGFLARRRRVVPADATDASAAPRAALAKSRRRVRLSAPRGRHPLGYSSRSGEALHCAFFPPTFLEDRQV